MGDDRRTEDLERWPVSPVQPGLWFASTRAADQTAYNQPLVLRPRVLLDHARLLRALRTVHRDHSALRTTFEMDAGGELHQLVRRDLDPITEVRDHLDGDAAGWVDEQVAEVAATVFDLRDGPLVRVLHLRLIGDRRSVLVFNIHHTVFDGMSWKPYLGQLEAEYAAEAEGRKPAGVVRRQAVQAYERWSGRQRDTASSRYWGDKLSDAPVPPAIGLPGDGPRRNVSGRLVLGEETVTEIREFCAAGKLTTSMFFVALWFALLHRHTGADDLLVGMPVTVRGPDDAGVVGHLTNTVVMRHRLLDATTARQLLDAARREVLDVLRHRHTPMEAIVGGLRAGGAALDGAGDLFTSMITVMPSTARALDLRDWGARTWEYTPGGAKYDLALVVDEAPDRLTLVVEHRSAAREGQAFAGFLARRLGTLLRSVLRDPDVPVRDLGWVSEREEAAVKDLCARRKDAPALGTELATDLFDAVASTWAGEPAVVRGGTVTTYADLTRRVDAVASGLVAGGVRDGQLVAVLMPPGAGLMATVIGVLRAGGAYLVLDAAQPARRLGFTLEDSGATILVHSPGSLPAGLRLPPRLRALEHSDARPSPDGPQLVGARGRKRPDDTAYVVYTSGSTGRPKGVVLPETTLTNLVRNQAHLSSGRRMRTLQYMPPSFDVFTLEVFGTLCTGGALVVPSPSARTDFGELAALLADERVERVYLPYVALCELAAVLRTSPLRLTALREVYVTGEALVITDDLRTMFRRCPDARLINAYGPSEAHLCTEDRLPADPATWPALPSIGRVVPGVDAYVVGRDHGDAERSDPVIRPLPFGVEGELCVAGPVVSTGYLGLPDTTRAVMVPDPFTPGQRMYRTGDVVLLTPDGRLHYRGRADQQVKIRGYRIEPGEVEAALERTLGAEAAVVLAVTTGTERALHAFVRSRERIPADWRSRLGSVVPNYMIPRGITRLDTIPVTANGKTDHRALEALIGSDDAPGKAPDCPGWDGAVTGSERAIARLWAEVLGGPPPGPEADFFSVGGHSLVAARLHRLVRERLDADVPLSALLSTPTVRGMARSLDHPGASAAVNLREEARLHDLDVRDRREPTGDMVLLTGATGFLGSQLLCELRRAGRRVGCLIRADGVEEGRRRLREALRTFDLPESLLAGTEILPGDLTRPGLGPGGWGERLADEVSEVYHAAAHINFAVPYRTVRQTNVDGLRELLDVCGANRTPLRLISTMGVFPPDSTSGVVREDTVPGDPESLGIGYSQSKWVAERLALEAGRAGLPVTVHRVGRIAGHSRTGACRHDDFFWLQLKGFAMLGCYPEDILDAPAVDLLPVDYVARAVVGLSTDGPADGIWHLHHPRGLTWRTVIERIRAEGYAVSPTDRPTWMSALERQAGTEGHGRRQGLGSLVPLMREGVMRLGRFGVDNTFTQNALFAAGCPIPPADPALIHRMFEYFRRLGALPSPGRDERRGLDA